MYMYVAKNAEHLVFKTKLSVSLFQTYPFRKFYCFEVE